MLLMRCMIRKPLDPLLLRCVTLFQAHVRYDLTPVGWKTGIRLEDSSSTTFREVYQPRVNCDICGASSSYLNCQSHG